MPEEELLELEDEELDDEVIVVPELLEEELETAHSPFLILLADALKQSGSEPLFIVEQSFISLVLSHFNVPPLLHVDIPSTQTGISELLTVPHLATVIFPDEAALKQMGSESLFSVVHNLIPPPGQDKGRFGFAHLDMPSSQIALFGSETDDTLKLLVPKPSLGTQVGVPLYVLSKVVKLTS